MMRLRLTFIEIAVLIILAGSLVPLAFGFYSGRLGQLDGTRGAEADLASGKLILKTGGKSQPWTGGFISLCRERHNVEVQHVYGCVASTRQMSYRSAYNEVMLKHLRAAAPEFDRASILAEAHDEWSRSLR